MDFKQSFKMAIRSLRGSKMRSFLTMLGIIIGVASVIVLISLMNGLAQDMTSRFESMGTNALTVSIFGRGGNRSFSVDDMENLVEENPQYLSAYSPMVTASITAKYGTNSVSTSATGVNEYYPDMQGVEVSRGRFIQYIDAERREKVCVIGTYISKELFDGDDSLGQTIKINGSNYTVIGILEQSANSGEGTADDVVYIPYSTAARLTRTGAIGSYYVSAADTNSIDYAITIIENALYKVFGSERAYRVVSMSAMIDTVNEVMASVSAVLVGIAAISLVVGGIGIMNIMLVSVTERTREIGIRKSVGAKRKAIMRQFIIESATTTSIGGVIGIIFGIGVSYAVGRVFSMSAVPSVTAVLMAFSVSVGIGMIFGYYPANKAAKMNPIEALRYE